MSFMRNLMDFGKLLFLINRGIRREVEKRLGKDITFLEFKTLIVLCKKPTTQKELNEILGLTKGTVSKTIRSLEAKGLLRRRRVGRGYSIEVTEKGRILIGEFEKIKKEIEEILFEGFTDEEKRNLLYLLEKIVENLEGKR